MRPTPFGTVYAVVEDMTRPIRPLDTHPTLVPPSERSGPARAPAAWSEPDFLPPPAAKIGVQVSPGDRLLAQAQKGMKAAGAEPRPMRVSDFIKALPETPGAGRGGSGPQ